MEALLITSLFFCLVFAFVCSSMAKSRNRGSVLWFFLGFFLGLIGVILLACLGRGTKGMKRCTNCAEYIFNQAKLCKHCGVEV